MAVLTPRSVFRRYEVDGVPSSGHHKVIKDEVVQLLEQIFGVSRGGWVVTQTREQLSAVTPPNETDGGVVLNDPDAINNGYYERIDGAWTKGRGFPDTFARVSLSGSGGEQTGIVRTAVNPADIEVFFAFVEAENDGPLTLSISGEPPREVVNLAGSALSAGEWAGTVMFALRDDRYQLLIDAGAAQAASLSAAASAEQADRAEDGADRSESAAIRAENSASSFIEVGTNFKTVATLIADETMGYAGSGKPVIVGEGDVATAQGFRYGVAAEDASGPRIIENANEVKLSVIHRQPGIHVGAYGEIGGANAAPAIQKMVDDLGYFSLPEGNLNVQDPIVIGSSSAGNASSIGAHSRGAGKERSGLVADGMSGESVIKFAQDGYTLARHNFSDFSVTGDADTALNLDVGSAPNSEFYQSRLTNLFLRSIGGPALRGDSLFSTTFDRIDALSDEDHAFDLPGGNTVLLQNCYAVMCGDNSAGYRIRGPATLIACNGINKIGDSHQCMHLGATGQFHTYTLIGCNLEDFGDVALLLSGAPHLFIENTSMLARGSGNFDTYIKNADSSGHTNIVLGGGVRPISKGATRTATSNIVMAAGCQITPTNMGPNPANPPNWPNVFKTGNLIELPQLAVAPSVEFGKDAYNFSLLSAGRFYGLYAPSPLTLPANLQTQSVAGRNCVVTANSSATTLQYLTGGVAGQEVTLIINDANTTIQHNAGPAANRMVLKSGTNETPANGAVYKFVFHANVWKQV